MNIFDLTKRIIYQTILTRVYLALIVLKSQLNKKQKKKILISNKETWEKTIRSGFQFTNHDVVFDDIKNAKLDEYDLVIPLSIDDFMYLNKFRNFLTEYAIPIPNEESILLCDDKYQFNSRLINSEFSAFIPPMGDTSSFPYMLKKKSDEYGTNTHVIDSHLEESKFIDLIENTDEYFTQKIITGKREFATHIVYKNGAITQSLNIQYNFGQDLPIKGKSKVIYRTICECPHLVFFEKILGFIGFEGICCFNYKEIDSHPFIIEINPRCGGSLQKYLFYFVENELA